MKKLFVLLFIVAAINSCTFEKRLYRPGFYVQRKGHTTETTVNAKQDKINKQILPIDVKSDEDNLLAMVDESGKPSEFMTERKVIIPIQKNHSLVKSIPPTEGTITQSKPKFNSTSQSRTNSKKEKNNDSGDSLIYLTSLLMGLATLGLLRGKRKTVMNLTRWAKANPKKAQGLIAGLQLPLLTLAFYSGHNLKELGYDLSDNLTFIYGPLLALGFLSVPFLAKRDIISIPKKVNRQKLGYLGITLSSLMMMTSIGNHVVERHPDSTVASIVKTVDHSVFNVHSVKTDNPDHTDCKCNTRRKVASAGMCILGIFLILLLLCTLCAGVCLIIFAVSGDIAAAFALLGIGVSALSVWGIIGSAKMCKSDNSKQKK